MTVNHLAMTSCGVDGTVAVVRVVQRCLRSVSILFFFLCVCYDGVGGVWCKRKRRGGRGIPRLVQHVKKQFKN